MNGKTVARALLEQFFRSGAGADAFIHAGFQKTILEGELKKKLTPEQFAKFMKSVAKSRKLEKLMYRKLASRSDFAEMDAVHNRINASFAEYKRDLERRAKMPG